MFALKTALWLLNPAPEIRNWTRSRVLVLYYQRPGQETKINKEQLFSTIVCDNNSLIVFITFAVAVEFYFNLFLC